MTCLDYAVRRLDPSGVTPDLAQRVSALMVQLGAQDIRSSADDLRRMCTTTFMAVAAPAGTAAPLAGLACLVVMDLPQGRRFLIESVIVDTEHRRRGVGRKLLECLLGEVERLGGGLVSLTCNPQRPEAHQLYHALGFRPANTTVFRLKVEPSTGRAPTAS